MIRRIQSAFGWMASISLGFSLLLLLLSFEVLNWDSSLAWRMVKAGGNLGFVALVTGVVWWMCEGLSAGWEIHE